MYWVAGSGPPSVYNNVPVVFPREQRQPTKEVGQRSGFNQLQGCKTKLMIITFHRTDIGRQIILSAEMGQLRKVDGGFDGCACWIPFGSLVLIAGHSTSHRL
jgi:hypothetical protein